MARIEQDHGWKFRNFARGSVGHHVLLPEKIDMSGYIFALLGIVGSAIGVYIAASFSLAQKQLLAATRLQAYLIYYARIVIDLEEAYRITSLGETWDKEEQAIVQRGGSVQEFVNLTGEKKKQWDQIAERANKNPGIVPDAKFTEVAESLKRLTARDAQWMLDALKVGRQNMLTGQTFITDEEATHLGVYVANNVIAFKMGVIDLMDGFTLLMTRSVESGQIADQKTFMEPFVKLLWRSVVVSRDYFKLRREAQKFTNSSVLKLTLRNIRLGSQLSKR